MGSISVFRLERYVEKMLEKQLEDLSTNSYDGCVILGYKLNGVVNRAKAKAEEEADGDPLFFEIYMKKYIIGFFVGVIEIDMEMIEKGTLTVEEVAEKAGVTPIEINELQKCLYHIDAKDFLNNYTGIFEDMNLISFGVLKAYVMLVLDGLMSIETAASRLGMGAQELESIVKYGIDMSDCYKKD